MYVHITRILCYWSKYLLCMLMLICVLCDVEEVPKYDSYDPQVLLSDRFRVKLAFCRVRLFDVVQLMVISSIVFDNSNTRPAQVCILTYAWLCVPVWWVLYRQYNVQTWLCVLGANLNGKHTLADPFNRHCPGYPVAKLPTLNARGNASLSYASRLYHIKVAQWVTAVYFNVNACDVLHPNNQNGKYISAVINPSMSKYE